MRNTYFIAAAAVTAGLLFGGCATKNSVKNLDSEVQGLQQQWHAFEQAYDPSTRRELEANLLRLQSLNEEVAILRDEVGRKTQRVSELLGQIDNNELDRAVQECRRYGEEADYFAATAQRHADAGLSYLEESRQTMGYALAHHLEKYHRVDEEKLLKRLERLEMQLAELKHDLKQSQHENRENAERDKKR